MRENLQAAVVVIRLDRGRWPVVPFRRQIITTGLALVALLVLNVIDADGVFSVPLTLWFAAQGSSLVFASVVIRRRARRHEHPPAMHTLLLALGLSSLLWEPISRQAFSMGRPLEMLVMHALGAVVWGLAILCAWERYQAPCALLSLFLALFGLSASHQWAVQALGALYAILMIAWLANRHWDHLHLVNGSAENQLSWRWLVTGLAVVLSLLVFAFVPQRELMATLNGFVPSSGGQGQSDPRARGGIGDGESLVAGSKNIKSFGPLDDAPLMTDDRPSLYDVFDDTYNEPVTPKKMDRSIALMPQSSSPSQDHLHSEVQKAGREFSTLRKTEANRRLKADSIRSDALFYVSGRTPLHLRLELYDSFDGISWQSEPDARTEPQMRMVQDHGRAWLRLKDHSDSWDFLGPSETHAIKIVRLETNVIPAPLYLHGIHIADVDRADMFLPCPDGLVRMDRETLPELVPIHLATRTVDQNKLSREKWSANAVRYLDVPNQLQQRLSSLASKWTQGASPGWSQVQAIQEHLRSHYHHDRNFQTSGNEESPLMEFLEVSKRGPDYQFATAAALLLRSLGYPTRVVSGFYAAPVRYDAKSRHTPVLRDDVHFWTEACLGGTAWITVEPTPGYEILQPPPSLFQQFVILAKGCIAWAGGHVLLLVLTFGIVFGLIAIRKRLFDWLIVLGWRLQSHSRRSAAHAWSILRCRLRSAGIAMPPGLTARQLLTRLSVGESDEFRKMLDRFADKLEAEVFSETSGSLQTEADAADAEWVVSVLTLPRCRQFQNIPHRHSQQSPQTIYPRDRRKIGIPPSSASSGQLEAIAI